MGFVVADPMRYLRLTLSRIPYHFRFWPTPGWRLVSNATRVASLGLALPFMAAGLVISRHAWRRLLPLYLFAVLYTLVHVLSWPGPRYRFPVDAVLLLFAGLALAKGVEWLLRRKQERGFVTPPDEEVEAT
jgi:hypothetical protein